MLMIHLKIARCLPPQLVVLRGSRMMFVLGLLSAVGTCPYAAGQITPGGKWPTILCLRQLESKGIFRWGARWQSRRAFRKASLLLGVRSVYDENSVLLKFPSSGKDPLAYMENSGQPKACPHFPIKEVRKRQGVSLRLLLLANAASACLLWLNACPTMPFNMPEPCVCGCGACGRCLHVTSYAAIKQSRHGP